MHCPWCHLTLFKRCKVVVNNIFKSQVKEDLVSKFNITNLNDVFAPVEVHLLSSDTSVKSPENNKNIELNASNYITNIIKTCGDGRAKNITKCSKPTCILGNKNTLYQETECLVLPPIEPMMSR